MSVISKSPKVLLLLAMMAGTATGSLAAQPQDAPEAELTATVTDDSSPAQMAEGPEIEGIISARSGNRVQVTAANGTNTVIAVNDATKIKGSGGFLGLGRNKLGADSLLNGLPVTVKTLQSGGSLLASQIELKNKDLKTASMIRN